MKHRILKLDTGLRVILVPIKDAKSLTLLKSYNVGSRQETDRISGAAHFIEHMMFKGTKKRKTARDITIELDSVGAQYNAFTGKDMTGYYIKISKENLELAFDILSDMTYNATFPENELEREKGVIIEEIKVYEDNPAQYVDDIYEQLVFDGSTLGRDIIGTRETITKMTRGDLLGYKGSFYADDNSVLVVAGYIPDDIEELLNSYFTTKEKRSDKYTGEYTKYNIEQDHCKIKIYKKDVEQVHIQLGFLSKGFTNDDHIVYSVISALLGGGMSSTLFDEVREKRGLCYYIKMYPSLYEDVGSIIVRAGLNKEKTQEAIILILSLLKDFRDNGVTDKELQKGKDYIIGNFLLNQEDTAHIAEMYVKRYTITGKLLTPDERVKRIKAVTKDDIMRVAKEIFEDSKINLAMITDDADEEKYKKLLTFDS